jgi:hypothetical protein
VTPVAPRFAGRFHPVVQWAANAWLEELHAAQEARTGTRGYPELATTLKTAMPSRGRAWGTARKDLRQRLAGYTGTLVVNGLAKDALLDVAWEHLEQVLEFCRASRVDVMVTPNWTLDGDATAAFARARRYYERCADLEFPSVVLDVPPFDPAIRNRYLNFIHDQAVPAIALSYQSFRGRSGLLPQHMAGAMWWHDQLPDGVHVLVYGVARQIAVAQLGALFRGRPLTFSGVTPYARAIFYQLVLPGSAPVRAPAGMSKATVFVRNVHTLEDLVTRTLAAVDRPATPHRHRRQRPSR